MRSVTYNESKFRELLVYIANVVSDDPGFGDTKLNKALYFCDFFGYSELGMPITGACYRKREHGPLAHRLLPVRSDLEHEGAVHMEPRKLGAYTAKVTVADRAADLSQFTEDEIELIDEVIAHVRKTTATQVSEVSHKLSAGWNLVEVGDEIPYSTALIETGPIPESAIAAGRAVAARLGW